MKRNFQRRLLCFLLSLFLVLFSCTPSFAWGAKGHQIIALIASQRLSTSARQGIATLLNKGETLESISTWADTRVNRSNSKYFDYVEIPLSDDYYNKNKHCPDQRCIVEALDQQIRILRNQKTSPNQRTEALKLVVHFVGDLHQPFHVTTNTNPYDQSANRVKVIFMKRGPMSLHSLWDDELVNQLLREANLSPLAYAQLLDTRFGISQTSNMSTQGSISDWAVETHKLAWGAYYVDKSFMIVQPQAWALQKPYFDNNRRVVEGQLARAGYRLARVLNEAFSVSSRY